MDIFDVSYMEEYLAKGYENLCGEGISYFPVYFLSISIWGATNFSLLFKLNLIGDVGRMYISPYQSIRCTESLWLSQKRIWLYEMGADVINTVLSSAIKIDQL